MKRFFIIAFVLVMAASSLSACSSRSMNEAVESETETKTSETESATIISEQTTTESAALSETEPVETEPEIQSETEPVEVKPTETQPETQPETKPTETKPEIQSETEPVEVKPTETQPETQPVIQPETTIETILETTPTPANIPQNREEMVQYAVGLGYKWLDFIIENNNVSISGGAPAPVERCALINASGTYTVELEYYPQEGFSAKVISGITLDAQTGEWTDRHSSGYEKYVNCASAEEVMSIINKYK